MSSVAKYNNVPPTFPAFISRESELTKEFVEGRSLSCLNEQSQSMSYFFIIGTKRQEK